MLWIELSLEPILWKIRHCRMIFLNHSVVFSFGPSSRVELAIKVTRHLNKEIFHNFSYLMRLVSWNKSSFSIFFSLPFGLYKRFSGVPKILKAIFVPFLLNRGIAGIEPPLESRADSGRPLLC